MIRFIFVCMAVVAFSAVAVATQFMTDGIGAAREDVMARNAVPSAVEPAAGAAEKEISFEEIYANAKAPEATGEAFYSPEELNTIDTAAGADSFPQGFTGKAPKALAEPAAPAPAAETIAE